MDNPFVSFPWWALALGALCLIGIIASIGMAGFTFLLQVGVAINEARKPAHTDSGDYRIEQGHEARHEDDTSA